MKNKIAFLSIFSILAILFQNCSAQLNFSQNMKSGSVESFRSFEIFPSFDKVANQKPIKVLLVIDNSGTMQASQDNLVKNIEMLFNNLNKFDTEVLIVTTDANYLKAESKNYTNQSGNNVQTITKKFQPPHQTYKFLKNNTIEDRNSELAKLKDYILNIGTNGSTAEKPVASVLMALNYESFFEKNDNALIYVITDENDDHSQNLFNSNHENLLISSIEEKTPDDFEFIDYTVPGYVIVKIVYESEYNHCENNIVGYTDTGEPIYHEQCDKKKHEHKTFQECKDFATNNNGFCLGSRQIERSDLLHGETIKEFCDRLREDYGANLLSCFGRDVTETNKINHGAKIVFSEKKYLFDIEKSEFDLNKGLALKLAELFGSNYLLSASVNTHGQSCVLQPGQAYDSTFSKLGLLIPSSRFFRTSICEQENLNGDTLNEISNKFIEVLKQSYSLKLEEKEFISEVLIIKNGNVTNLKHLIDYDYTQFSFTILNDTFFDFDSIKISTSLQY